MARLQNIMFTTLGNIVDNMSYNPSTTRQQKIELAREYLFLSNYPVLSEEWRKDFETNFIRNFYFTEIGFETEGRFKFELETWLQINMEYYVKLLKSQLYEEMIQNPLSNYDLTEKSTQTRARDEEQSMLVSQTGNATSNGTSENETEVNSFNRELSSQTPEERLAITAQDGVGLIEYASTIDENRSIGGQTETNETSETTNTTNNQNGSTDIAENETIENELTRVGNIGIMTYDQLLNGYRTIFKRFEKQIYDEMRTDLFMLVY